MAHCLKSKQGGESGDGTGEGSAVYHGGGSASGSMASGSRSGGGVDLVAIFVWEVEMLVNTQKNSTEQMNYQ